MNIAGDFFNRSPNPAFIKETDINWLVQWEIVKIRAEIPHSDEYIPSPSLSSVKTFIDDLGLDSDKIAVIRCDDTGSDAAMESCRSGEKGILMLSSAFIDRIENGLSDRDKFVIAHEMGHFAYQHSRQKIDNESKIVSIWRVSATLISAISCSSSLLKWGFAYPMTAPLVLAGLTYTIDQAAVFCIRQNVNWDAEYAADRFAVIKLGNQGVRGGIAHLEEEMEKNRKILEKREDTALDWVVDSDGNFSSISHPSHRNRIAYLKKISQLLPIDTPDAINKDAVAL